MNTKDVSIDVFSKESCVIYSSFVGTLGQIKYVSRNFENVFEIESSLVLQKNIDFITPSGMNNIHGSILQKYINSLEIPQKKSTLYMNYTCKTKQKSNAEQCLD